VYIVESFCAALPHPKDEVASYIAGSDQVNSTTCSASVLVHLRGVTWNLRQTHRMLNGIFSYSCNLAALVACLLVLLPWQARLAYRLFFASSLNHIALPRSALVEPLDVTCLTVSDRVVNAL
jgi:hypothetical protein